MGPAALNPLKYSLFFPFLFILFHFRAQKTATKILSPSFNLLVQKEKYSWLCLRETVLCLVHSLSHQQKKALTLIFSSQFLGPNGKGYLWAWFEGWYSYFGWNFGLFLSSRNPLTLDHWPYDLGFLEKIWRNPLFHKHWRKLLWCNFLFINRMTNIKKFSTLFL